MINQNGNYPLSNEAFDVIAIIFEKSRGLGAYEKYLTDVQPDTKLRQLLVNIKHDDQRHVEALKAHLTRLLSQ